MDKSIINDTNKNEVESHSMMEKYRRLTLISFLTILLLSFVMLILLSITPIDKLVNSTNKMGNKELSLVSDKLFDLSDDQAEKIYPFNSEYLLDVNNELISYLTYQGEIQKSISIETNQAKLVNNDDYAIVYDLKGFNYYLLNNNGLILSGSTTAPILAAEVSNNGYIALIINEPTTKGMIRLIDNNGHHILDYKLRERLRSGYPINLKFSPQNNSLFINVLNLDSANIITNIHRIDLNSLEIQSNLNIYEGKSLPLMHAINDHTLILANNENIIFSDLNNLNSVINFSNITNYSFSDSGISILAKYQKDDNNDLYYIDNNNIINDQEDIKDMVLGPIHLDKEPLHIHMENNLISIITEKGVYVIPTSSNASQTYFYELQYTEVVRQKFLNSDQLLLICKDQVRIIDL